MDYSDIESTTSTHDGNYVYEEDETSKRCRQILSELTTTTDSLDQTIKECSQAIQRSHDVKKEADSTFKRYDDFKENFQKTMDQVFDKLTKNLRIGPPSYKNTEKYGKAIQLKQLDQISEFFKIQKNQKLNLVFLTGAGISLASGISTYRGKDSNQGFEKDGKFYKNEEIATVEFMNKNPEIFWERYQEFYKIAKQAVPNEAHKAIATLQILLEKSTLKNINHTLITQNIDNLHVQAYQEQLNKYKISSINPSNLVKMNPSDTIYQIHGNVLYGRCSKSCSDKIFKFNFDKKNSSIPRCDLCNNQVNSRPNVLYFDELYDEQHFFIDSLKSRIKLDQKEQNQDNKSNDEIKQCLIVIGTSLETNFANKLVQEYIEKKFTIIEINMDPIIDAGQNTYQLQEKSEIILPKLCKIIQKNIGLN